MHRKRVKITSITALCKNKGNSRTTILIFVAAEPPFDQSQVHTKKRVYITTVGGCTSKDKRHQTCVSLQLKNAFTNQTAASAQNKAFLSVSESKHMANFWQIQ